MAQVNKSIEQYCKQLASDSPTPGGGSASAVVATMGFSLGVMVLGILIKKATPAKKKTLSKMKRTLSADLTKAKKIIDSDVKAYSAVVSAYKLKRGTKGREKRIETSLKGAYNVMHDLAEISARGKGEITKLKKMGQGSIINDVLVAIAFLDASFKGAKSTAKINLDYIVDENLEAQLMKRYKSLK